MAGEEERTCVWRVGGGQLDEQSVTNSEPNPAR